MFRRTSIILALVLCAMLVTACAAVPLYLHPRVVLGTHYLEADFGPFTPNTQTSGFQEAVNYCVANHLDLFIKGGPICVNYGVWTTVHIPACRNFKIEGRGLWSITWYGESMTDPLMTIDSAQDCSYEIGSLVYPGTGEVLAIRPTNAPPNGQVGFVDSYVRVECVTNMQPFASPPPQSAGIGLRLDSSYGPIRNNDFYIVCALNMWVGTWITDTGYGFHHNRVEIGSSHTNAQNCYILYAGTGGCWQNDFIIRMGDDIGPSYGNTGLYIAGANNNIHLTSTGVFPGSCEVGFASGATGNVLTYLPYNNTDNPWTLVTDQSASCDNRITSWQGAQMPISRIAPLYTDYGQRLYPVTARLSGGTLNGVQLWRNQTYIDYGAYRGDIFMSPGDLIAVDAPQNDRPTLTLIPRIK